MEKKAPPATKPDDSRREAPAPPSRGWAPWLRAPVTTGRPPQPKAPS